ncbi:serine/threonine-protein kinase [Actinoplanes derwentensis]|uniref:non-specific serine/threonine protein kinase n=1 Tax=Actinoplanes derwentensis TaxID=113562 RepID=A0A1H1TS71_9ACTN|nr:serine/threonine-protein kinase [Actinoplanes derwentensis]GID85119.1 hypothetical protein Ade03nite_40430 [Actinoplanes derwentensis]SDS63123.1 Serine/threonine protein kinase [Actinoplanes derwentensis]
MAEYLTGRYRLAELIGAGGMGRVWRAEDMLLGRTVAVKELPVTDQETCADRETRAAREARAGARLNHPGLIKVYDVLVAGGRSWIVMEYVPSRSLHQVVRADGPSSPAETARLGLEVLAALRAAHAAGVVHRDVKPDNVLIAADGRVVLGDFGLAAIGADAPDPRFGSPDYIAPERLLAQESGVAGDLWSFGATLYFTAEGRPPFTRGDGGAVLRALLADPPDRTRRSGPLTALLLALLHKDPDRRPTPDEVTAYLLRVAYSRARRRFLAAA